MKYKKLNLAAGLIVALIMLYVGLTQPIYPKHAGSQPRKPSTTLKIMVVSFSIVAAGYIGYQLVREIVRTNKFRTTRHFVLKVDGNHFIQWHEIEGRNFCQLDFVIELLDHNSLDDYAMTIDCRGDKYQKSAEVILATTIESDTTMFDIRVEGQWTVNVECRWTKPPLKLIDLRVMIAAHSDQPELAIPQPSLVLVT
jgi:hypothetical protein